jgi:acetoin utilization deacetylase AcuC-like enzyme
MTTLLFTHPACLDHTPPHGHPERPERLRAIEEVLAAERFQFLAREQAPEGNFDSVALGHSE